MAAMQADSNNSSKANTQIARAAGTVMAAFVVSKLIGLFATTLTARVFGVGIDSSAFFAANRFSEILFNLVAGGALGSAFIPVFTGLLAEGQKQKAWKLAYSIANLISIVLLVFSLLTLVFARQVVQFILAPGFSPGEVALTANLLRIQVISSVIFGLSGLAMGVLNSHQHFLLPALAPAMYQLGWIFGIFVLKPTLGIFGLAWGVVIGALFHLLIQLPMVFRLPQSTYRPSFGLDMPEVREVGRLMAPRLLGVAVVQLNFLINTLLASFQPVGSIAAINLAFPLMIMPESALAQSIAIAALPTFASQVAKKQFSEMRTSLSAAIRVLLLLSVPASIGLILLRKPIVMLLYQGNQFSADSTDLVAWALLFYAIGLVGHSVVEILSRAFYALHDTRTPVLVGVGAMSFNLALSFLFVWLFRLWGLMPHGGLALANSTATLIESVILLVLMRKRLEGLEEQKLMLSLFKALIAGAGMATVILLLNTAVHLPGQLFNVLLSVAVGMFTYGILLVILKTEELKRIFGMVKERFVRR